MCDRVYFAAVCRCFPGKKPSGGDRVASPDEIERCDEWLAREFALLQPTLVLTVGKLAITRFVPAAPLTELIRRQFSIENRGSHTECVPLSHPSGASP